MVQNAAQAPQIPQATQEQASQKSSGLGGALKQSASIIIPGALVGGGVGGALSLLPPGKSRIKSEIIDVFEASAKDEIKSKKTVELLKRADLSKIKGKTGDALSSAVDELISKLPKNDEFIKLAKKAAKSKNTKRLIKNGAFFGILSMLVVSLLQTRKKPEQSQ